jgi:hypothetical protein
LLGKDSQRKETIMPQEQAKFDVTIIKQNCPNHKQIHYRIDVKYEDVEAFEKWFGVSKVVAQEIEASGAEQRLVCEHVKKEVKQ